MRGLASAVVVVASLRMRLWLAFIVVVVTQSCAVGAGPASAAAAAAPVEGRADEQPAAATMRTRFESLRRSAPERHAATRELEQQWIRQSLLRREALMGEDDNQGRDREGRNLIYNGKPTGGGKYPFLVSMWMGTSNNVSNPNFFTPAMCQGVMITDDMFVTMRGCFLDLNALRLVLVGDYDSSRPMNESVQLREVELLADDVVWTYGLLSEPVTFPGFFPATMNNDPNVPEPGQNLTVVGYGGRLLPMTTNDTSFEFNLTSWPEPVVEATLVAGNRSFCKSLWDQVGILAPSEHLYSFCGAPSSTEDVQPCKDDIGGLVLDNNNNVLLGLTWVPGCGFLPGTIFLRWSFTRIFVRAAICSLSRSGVLPVACPDFSCPLNKLQVGYPWSEIPELTGGVRARNGFRPVDITQFPPPGSIIRFDSSTKVTINATDSTNQSRTCSLNIQVPPLVSCGSVSVDVPLGTSLQRGVFTPNPDRTTATIVGTAFKMKGILKNRLAGRGSITARLRKGSDKYTGSIQFKGNRTKGALNNLAIVEPFNVMNSSQALQVDLHVVDNINPERNVANYTVYCQEVF